MSSWNVFLNGGTRVDARDLPGDYRPPHDQTMTRIRVNRPCIITLLGDKLPTTFPAGSIVSVQRWQALVAVEAGRCTLLE